ncbi:MAG: DUF2974 domain-containing protein [Candidatus Saccharibacteria bacterium]|nr:DUF2974 domain-containing protein [Candidatus Saccharibacteria bacterium]
MLSFIKKYGSKTFKMKPFGEVDNVILSTLAYLDFSGIIPKDKHFVTLGVAVETYLKTHNKKQVSNLGIAMKNAWTIAEAIKDQRRYKNLYISNYEYIIDSDTQFSAMTVHLGPHTKFIVFEGTDEMISGWKEDFFMPFKFPVDAHTYAIEYLNHVVTVLDRTIFIGGHSKGGNLALVSAMYARPHIKPRIRTIYSNDGPGLRQQEFKTFRFKNAQKKLVHIVPDHSIVGMFLSSGEHTCVKSNRRGPFAHSTLSWVVEDDHFKRCELSESSKTLEKNLLECLSSVPTENQEKAIDLVFKSVEKSGAKSTRDLLSLRRLGAIISNLRGIDAETRKMMTETFKIMYKAAMNKGDKK